MTTHMHIAEPIRIRCNHYFAYVLRTCVLDIYTLARFQKKRQRAGVQDTNLALIVSRIVQNNSIVVAVAAFMALR